MNYQDLQLKFLKAIDSFDQLQLSQGAFLIDETQMPVPQVPEFGEDYIVDSESALQQFKSDYDKQVAEEKPIVDEEGYSEEHFDGNSDEDSEEIREEE